GVHRRQLPGVRLPETEPLRDPRLEPWVQDDRRRPRGGEGDRGGALEPALPVPLRALLDRRPAPRLELAVSLVLGELEPAAKERPCVTAQLAGADRDLVDQPARSVGAEDGFERGGVFGYERPLPCHLARDLEMKLHAVRSLADA